MEYGQLAYHFSKLVSELKHQIASEVLLRLDDSKTLTKSTVSNEELLTPKQLWTVLKISESHFYKMKKKHKDFPFYDFDGTKRYKLSEVEDFFKSNK